MPVRATPQTVSAPIYKAIADARKAGSAGGSKITTTEARAISKAMDAALDAGFKKLSPEDTFTQLPYAAGFGVMQTLKKGEFVKQADFTKLWNKAVDIASAAPDIGNYLPD